MTYYETTELVCQCVIAAKEHILVTNSYWLVPAPIVIMLKFVETFN